MNPPGWILEQARVISANGIPANPATKAVFRESKVLLGDLLMVLSQAPHT